MNTILNFENAHAINRLAELIGWPPDRLVNRLLKETLDLAIDSTSGRLEEFLGSLYYDDWASSLLGPIAEHSKARSANFQTASLASQPCKSPGMANRQVKLVGRFRLCRLAARQTL